MQDDAEREHGLTPPSDIFALPRTLWQRRALIVLTAAAVALLAGLYVVFIDAVYTAKASILVHPRNSRATSSDTVSPPADSDSAMVASQVAVIESSALLSRVFADQRLADDPELARRGLLSTLAAFVRTPKPVTQNANFRNFQDHVSVEREGLTYVIDISVTSHDPAKAARIANAIVRQYRTDLATERKAAEEKVTSFLNEKIDGLRKEVADDERAIDNFRSRHPIQNADAAGTLRLQIDQLSTRLDEARDKAGQAEHRYRQAVEAGDTPKGMIKLADIRSSATADELRQEYDRQTAALANAEMVYGPRYPTIINLKAELSRLRGRMVQEARRITRQLKAERDRAEDDVGELQSKLAALRTRSDEADRAQAKLRQLERQADAARAVLADFIGRSQETARLKDIQVPQVRVISRARPPTTPTWPKPKLLIPASAVFGLLAGCGLALLAGPRRPPHEKARDEALRPAAPPRLVPIEPVATTPAPVTLALAAPAPVAPFSTERLRPNLPSLGTYALPAGATGTTRNQIKAIRQDLRQPGESALSLAVLRLLRRIVGRLNRHHKPFILNVSSFGGGIERKLAAALIGMGLQQLEEKVLVVEIAGHAAEPTPLTSVSASRGTARFTDQVSGLQTMVFGVDSADGGKPPTPAIETILRKAGSDIDFIIVVGPPLNDPTYDMTLQAGADLSVYALGSAADEAAVAARLHHEADGAALDNKATLLIERPAGERAESVFKPRLVASRPSPKPPARRQG